jgi:Icc-related predicted phosphoesterase
MNQPPHHHGPATLRVAAAGDIHCREGRAEEAERAFDRLEDPLDLVLLAGDLTAHGEPGEAAVLASACQRTDAPVFAVLGNHDWHLGRQDEITAILTEAGVRVLERDWVIHQAPDAEVGIVGTKGFVGGFAGSHLSDFGEPALRRLYAETSDEVDALHRGLYDVATCPFRIVLLHYSPAAATLEGEPPGIWTFLGTDRLAAPILEHGPDLVLHGHAHHGSFEARIGDCPVYNVSVPVIGRDFWRIELKTSEVPVSPVH